MYTVGQVAKFLGVSRDTLKFYEEKELVNPKQDRENNYRQYDEFDIYDVITVNFYRELDLEIKKIQEIKKSKQVDEVMHLLTEKEEQLVEEIKFKQQLVKQLQAVKEDCEKVKQYLGKFTIKDMKPVEVKGVISHLTAYDEYEVISKESEKKAVTYSSLSRVIYFNEQGMTHDHFIIVRKLDGSETDVVGDVLSHPKCIYTVIENGRFVNGGKNIDAEVGDTLMKIAYENNYELLGITYINILITTYEKGLERIFLEIYTPIK